MGSVVSFMRPAAHEPEPGFVPHAGRKMVDLAYARLSKAPGYASRPEQQLLSHHIAAALLANEPYIGEAPTGSGKTIGYAIGALAAGRELGLPIVIATATVALQGQVMSSDLKRMEATGLVAPGSYKLVRGRGRFFCQVAAQAAVGGATTVGFQPELFDEQSETKAEDLFDAGRVAPGLLAAFESGEWDGTRDALPGDVYLPRPSVWHHLSSSPESCLRQNCEHFKSCPFFQARAQWEGSKILVANHHLVLLDLMAAAAGQPTVFPFKEYILVLDEAHHLPDTALATAHQLFKPGMFLDQLQRLEVVLRDVYRNAELGASLSQKVSTNPRTTIRVLKEALAKLFIALQGEGISETSFDKSGLLAVEPGWGPEVRAVFDEMHPLFLELTTNLGVILRYLPTYAQRADKAAQVQVMASALGAVTSQIKAQHNGVLAFLTQEVKWLAKQHCGVLPQGWQPVFNGSPLEGREILAQLLWAQPKQRVRVAMVSATVRGTNEFDHFIHQVGLTDDKGAPLREVRTQVLPSRFAFEDTHMDFVAMRHSPNEKEFVTELMAKLPVIITPNKDKGTLVLFTNRRTMRMAYERLQLEFGDLVICQDSHGGALKVRSTHCERIDNGMPSILLGVKSLAEGFDLPGHYCTHLVVTQLPFEVPTTPLERARQATYGDDYFASYVLPRTARELKQITGRLLRREDDWGRISVMDRRLRQKSYGTTLVDSLPPYAQRDISVDPAPPIALASSISFID